MSAAASLLAAATAVEPLVRAHADEAEAARRLSPPVIEALRDAGLFRMCVPAAYGGPEADPLTMSDAIVRVAAADGAAGWCVMIASTTSSLSLVLDPEAAAEIYGDPLVVTGGAYAPTGTAESVAGGYRVSGRWQWGSGTDHCEWITGGVLTDRGEFRLAFLPAARIRLIDTWFSSGLRATASGDFEADAVEVADRYTVQPGVTVSPLDAPLARFPIFTLLASGVASACLGMGRRAIDELVALAQGKRPAFSAKTLASSELTQLDVARAEAGWSAARAFLRDELAVAWDAAVAGDPVTEAQRARIRMACSHAATESARAVDLCYDLGGGSSVFASSPLQRCFRDVHTATQHIMVSKRPLQTVGKLLLGVAADTAML